MKITKPIMFWVGMVVALSSYTYANSWLSLQDEELRNFILQESNKVEQGSYKNETLPEVTKIEVPPIQTKPNTNTTSNKPVENVTNVPPFSMKMISWKTCSTINNEVQTFVKNNEEYFSRGIQPFGRYWFNLKSSDIVEERNLLTTAEAKAESSSSVDGSAWASNYSETNIQKKWVDEPDILKINSTLFAYLHDNKIEIVSWNDTEKRVISKLELPENFTARSLLLKNDTLLVLGNRFDNQEKKYHWNIAKDRTTVLAINLINPSKPSLKHLVDLAWFYDDARIIWDKLFVFWNLYLNVLDWNTFKDFDIEKIIPNSFDSYIDNSKIKVNQKGVDCSDISILLPDSSTLKKQWFNPSFTSVGIVDLNNFSYKQKLIMGNWFDRHVSDKSVYLVSHVWEDYMINCWNGFRCFLPNYLVNDYSLINKFTITKKWDLTYQSSNLVFWSPLSQYSMDEDKEWNFRIITQNYSNQKGTSIFKLNKQMNVVWSLTWIEPEENFKSSRFIEDKLYLVTFKNIDPLFVVDMKWDSPKILGELKIPWYSTYLHPYSSIKNNKQLLIWVGYDTTEKNWATRNSWLKLDLYEIDYNTTPIGIKQIWTKVFGTEWTISPVQENPRSFVFDDKNKNLILPIAEFKNDTVEICDYHKRTVNWVEENTKNCYNDTIKTPTFFWTKVINISDKWVIEEREKIDWLQFVDWRPDEYWKKMNQIRDSRAWYLGNKYFFLTNKAYIDNNSTLTF